MNKHDIEELQSFLQGEYIEEYTSRSLKEVKQHQQTLNKNKANVDLTYVKKFARKYCTHLGKRRNTRWGMYIERSDCKTDKDIAAFEYLKNILGSNQPTKVKINKFVKLLGLEGYRIDMLIGDDIIVDDDHMELSFQLMTQRERINPIGRIFIHTTDSPSLDHLDPKEGNSAGTRTYPGKASFFWAIKANNVNEALKKIPDRYGRYSYQYIPTGGEDIFLDVLHNRISVKITDDVIPVFIQRNSAIPIRLIKESHIDETDGDYISESESVESYIDKTIERFDAFMEEFNNGQIGDSEFIMESAQDNEYAKIVKDYIKKSGRRYFKYKRGEGTLPKEVEDRIFDLAKKIVEFPPNGDYSQYKMYYKSFCRIVNYPLDTVIMGMMINDEHKGYINMGGLNYPGAKRCVLKPGTHLFHSSDNPNLTMINPNHFKGKPNIVEIGDEEIPTGDYDSYYACPRIYFHVEKMGSRQASAYGTVKYDSNNMPIIENKPTSRHMYMYIVKPTDRIFFDPELNVTGDKDGAVYMLIDKPVRLTKIY